MLTQLSSLFHVFWDVLNASILVPKNKLGDKIDEESKMRIWIITRRNCIVSGTFLFLVLYCHSLNNNCKRSKHIIRPNSNVDDSIIVRNNQRRLLIHSLLVSGSSSILSTPIFNTKIIQPCYALSPEETAIQYDTYAPTYNNLDGGIASSLLGIEEARISMIRQATGNVLEIGVGTGLNLDKYDNKLVTSLTLVDISNGMLTQASERAKELVNLQGIPITYHIIDVTSNELVSKFGTETFDTVIDSFSLCVMGTIGAQQCMNQLAQVVKKKTKYGKILLLENTKSSNYLLGVYQDITANAAATIGGKGCVYNQNVEQIINNSGQLKIIQQTLYSAGLFRLFECYRI